MARLPCTTYASGSDQYAVQGTEKPFTFKGKPDASPAGAEVMSWIYSNDNPYYPKDNCPRFGAWDLDTGKVVWTTRAAAMSGPYVLGANLDMIDLPQDGKLVSTGPATNSRECLRAVVTNGRIFYTSQASGFVVSQTYGDEAKKLPAVWERK